MPALAKDAWGQVSLVLSFPLKEKHVDCFDIREHELHSVGVWLCLLYGYSEMISMKELLGNGYYFGYFNDVTAVFCSI